MTVTLQETSLYWVSEDKNNPCVIVFITDGPALYMSSSNNIVQGWLDPHHFEMLVLLSWDNRYSFQDDFTRTRLNLDPIVT